MSAHNDIISTMSLTALRAEYQGNFFPEHPSGKQDPALKDLNFAELNYYGKIDTNGRPIYVDESNLVNLGQSALDFDTTHKSVLPFIKKMHGEMRENISIKLAVGSLISTDRSFASLEPIHAYTSPILMYQNYLRTLLIQFNTEYLTQRDKNNITSYESYVKHLYKYFLELDAGEPITFSGWTTSHYNSIFTTGLALSIKEYQYHDDRDNINFAENILFGYYKKLAMNKGFCLVKQAPWILIADLNSPAISSLHDLGFNTAGDLFDTYYNRTYLIDIELIINNIINYYNDFVLLNENKRTIGVTCNNKTFINNHQRVPMLNIQKYTDKQRYLTMYANLRNKEEKSPLSKGDLAGMIKSAKKKLDISSATGYIADIFASELFRKPFGFNDLFRREVIKTSAAKGIKLSKEQATEQVLSGGNMSSGGSGGGY